MDRRPLRPPFDGSTILVTGASAGIGRALARALAPRAGHLLLVARRVDRLERDAADLAAEHPGLHVHVVGCDLADDDDVSSLIARLGRDLPNIDVLVANAGVGQSGLFESADPTALDRVMAVNVLATTRLLRAVVPGMTARGSGGVLIIGSGAGLSLMPAAAAYTASKHYVHGLAQSVRAELRGTGVVVTEACPGPVATEFDAVAGIPPTGSGPGAWFRLSAETCAQEAVRGLEAGKALVFPGRAYKAAMMAQKLFPLSAQRYAAARAAGRLRARAGAGATAGAATTGPPA